MIRFFGRILPVCGLAALLCVLFSGLICSSEAAKAPEETTIPVEALLRCVAEPPVSQPAAPTQCQGETRSDFSSILPETDETPMLVLCDGNGWPLNGRTWVRAAWAANPP